MKPESGGVCQTIRNIIQASHKHAYVHHEVLCFDLSSDDYLGDDEFVVHAIGPAMSPYAYCKRLAPWLEKNMFRFEVVIVHGLWLYNNYGSFRVWNKYRKKKGVPKLFIMPHGMLAPYFQKAKERKWKAWRNEIVWRLIENRSVNNVDALLFTCEEEMLQARTTFKGYKPEREINIGNGIAHPPVYTAAMKTAFKQLCGHLNNRPYWLFMSRIHPVKGMAQLVTAYKDLCGVYPDLPDLVIAGPTDTAYAESIMSLVGNNEKVHFPGMLSGHSKWGALYGCKAFIQPSYHENFGVAVVEAMACKKPVMLTKQVNIWREIEQGGGGIVITDNAPVNIGDALVRMNAITETAYAVMSDNAYETFMRAFHITDTVNHFLTEIQKLV
ncbi:glycosyltransferase [Chitinophaga sp. 30R24]|uniref:glycosyltransferase n=1 Tax=Chitinophaga sp. 30R24 TaxID=3248838 RepID=UPI003B8FB751